MVYIVDPNYCAVNVSYTESLPTMFTTNSVVVVPSISHTFQVFFFVFWLFTPVSNVHGGYAST